MSDIKRKDEKSDVKIEEPVEVEQKPKGRGKGGWKTNKYSLTKGKGDRYQFNYRFNENEKLEYILRMFCTFHSNCNSNYDLIDLINQQYKNEDLLGSAVSYICINYNSLNLQKLINEGAKIE